MKLSKEDIAGLMELLGQADDFRPLVEAGVSVLLSFGPEISKVFSAVGLGLAAIRVKTIAYYAEKGFTHKEAIELTMDDMSKIQRSLDRMGNQRNKT